MDVGDQLPWTNELTDDRGRPLNWRDTRRNRVVLFAHPGGCAGCSRYARMLLDRRDALARWDGDLWVVGDTTTDLGPLPDDVTCVSGDAGERLRRRCALSATAARLIVADRWGQIWQTAAADERHTLVDPADVVETTKFIAIQCPECETLDQPIGDWSSVR